MKIRVKKPSSYPDTLADIADGEAFWFPKHASPLHRTQGQRINPAFMETNKKKDAALAEVFCICLRTGAGIWIAENMSVCARALQIIEDPNA